MMNRLCTILSVLFALSPAAAQAAPPPQRPDFRAFSFLIGTWTCTTRETDRPGPQPWTATWRLDDQGYWLIGKSDYPPVKWFPYHDKVQQRITFDAGAKSWIYENAHSMGGYNLYTSPGFTGDTAVWTDHSFLPTKKTRAISIYTLKKIGERKYVGSFAITSGTGTVIAVRDTCIKS